MIKIDRLIPPNYHKNMEKAGDAPTCVICGRGITSANPRMVHVHCGGWTLVTEDEATHLDPAADMGLFPIGPECLRRHPEIRPYVISS